jgi:hypothetical protein
VRDNLATDTFRGRILDAIFQPMPCEVYDYAAGFSTTETESPRPGGGLSVFPPHGNYRGGRSRSGSIVQGLPLSFISPPKSLAWERESICSAARMYVRRRTASDSPGALLVAFRPRCYLSSATSSICGSWSAFASVDLKRRFRPSNAWIALGSKNFPGDGRDGQEAYLSLPTRNILS